MLGNWSSHSDYQTYLIDSLNNLFPSHKDKILEFQKGISKLYLLNLNPLKDLITHLFSNTGRPSTQQDIIFRSFVLMSDSKITSISTWCKKYLSKNPVVKAAVGLKIDEHPPSVGAHYDFIARIVSINDSARIKSVTKKPRKKYKLNEKLPLENKGIVDPIVNFLIKNPVNSISSHKLNLLQQVFSKIIVDNSAKYGFLGYTSNLDVSSDGTCLATGASSYGKKMEKYCCCCRC